MMAIANILMVGPGAVLTMVAGQAPGGEEELCRSIQYLYLPLDKMLWRTLG